MESRLSPGLVLRPARVSDAAAITRLMAAADAAEGGEAWVTETDIVEDLNDPDLNLETDTWVVEDGTAMVGYGELWNAREEAADAMEAQAWTAPTHVGRGIGSTLIELSEAAAVTAARRFDKRPVLLRNFIWAQNQPAREMLEARDYAVVRHFFHMGIDVAELPPPPAAPDGLELRSLDPATDPRPLFELIVQAFRNHWNWSPMTFENFWRRIAERDDFDPYLTPVVLDQGRLIGASINATKLGQGWVQDLAVHESARRRGTGELLLRHSFARFAEKGWTKVGLGLDSGNATGALRLYERVGMHITRRFDAFEKEIVA
ncbi:MAG TPA: GNAT family N-acetyltransferase [Actinomycetota bacterium]|nr:GNAT family N-acetyltransferase [Actinomycetota bacterium]